MPVKPNFPYLEPRFEPTRLELETRIQKAKRILERLQEQSSWQWPQYAAYVQEAINALEGK